MYLVPPGPQLLSFPHGLCGCLWSRSPSPQQEEIKDGWELGHEDWGAKEGEKMRIKEEMRRKFGLQKKKKKKSSSPHKRLEVFL